MELPQQRFSQRDGPGEQNQHADVEERGTSSVSLPEHSETANLVPIERTRSRCVGESRAEEAERCGASLGDGAAVVSEF